MNRRNLLAIFFVVTLLSAVASLAWATTSEVRVVDSKFDPKTVTISVGDTVHWSSSGTFKRHSVIQDKQIFASGLPTQNLDFSVTFSAGTFPYFCKNHGKPGGKGMSGVVRVTPTILAEPDGLPFTVVWSSGSTQTGTRFDVQYRIGSGARTVWKSGTGATRAVFGQGNQPVKVKAGATYSFKVRSLKSGAASRWSPVASFTP